VSTVIDLDFQDLPIEVLDEGNDRVLQFRSAEEFREFEAAEANGEPFELLSRAITIKDQIDALLWEMQEIVRSAAGRSTSVGA
jgi:hypothetical protein